MSSALRIATFAFAVVLAFGEIALVAAAYV